MHKQTNDHAQPPAATHPPHPPATHPPTLRHAPTHNQTHPHTTGCVWVCVQECGCGLVCRCVAVGGCVCGVGRRGSDGGERGDEVCVCVWWWCGRDALHVCLSIRASCVQLIKKGQCQCTSPFGWTDQPEKPAPVPSEGSFQAFPKQNLTQPQVEEKDCEARPPHLPSPTEEGRAIFSISSALDAPDPEYREKKLLDVSSWLAGPILTTLLRSSGK